MSNAPEIDSEKVLAQYAWTHLQCRVDRHLWSRNYVWELIDPTTLERQQACTACSTVRYVYVDRASAERLTNFRYRYAKGFRAPGAGLGLADFRERLDQESLAKAFKAGKVHGMSDPKLEEKRQAKRAG